MLACDILSQVCRQPASFWGESLPREIQHSAYALFQKPAFSGSAILLPYPTLPYLTLPFICLSAPPHATLP
ncbi:hypothetical protein ccbrp13_59920 [Ktedonobacteria bacterium brp13]|nr:hypothetical protein ccbrp13_59920 [Ktedonobacteria bacterium brp13]